MANPETRIKYIKAALAYDPGTGEFRRQAGQLGRGKAGALVGNLHSSGYHCIEVQRVIYKAHRLAWLFVYGEWPDGQIDHIDGNRANNRIANLRKASQSQNQANRKKNANSSSPYKGVRLDKGGKWVARIQSDGRRRELGYFPTPEEAHAAYIAAATRVFGPFARAE